MKYTQNQVLILRPDELPSFEEYFSGDLEEASTYHRHYTLAQQDTTYLLLPEYERVEPVDWLAEPLTVTKRVKVPVWSNSKVTTSVCNLRRSVVRGDGRFELRKVETNPSGYDKVPDSNYDLPFKDEYLTRPLKRVSIGDIVFVVPSFHRYKVVSGRADGLGFNLVPEMEEEMEQLLEVRFDEVLVLQSFICRDGGITKVLLKADFRGVE